MQNTGPDHDSGPYQNMGPTQNRGPDPEFRSDLIAAMPKLLRFARSLCRKADLADDLLQETMMRAWGYQARFKAGSNLNAWLCTILRNCFVNHLRRQRREISDVDGLIAARVSCEPDHDSVLDLGDFRTAMRRLPASQQDALLLVGALGYSLSQAAREMNCQIGTIKSRLSRARNSLGADLKISGPAAFGALGRGTAPRQHAAPQYA